ncbi:MAG: hypothetical protein AAB697_03165 [Patescibacteria group bacterium]
MPNFSIFKPKVISKFKSQYSGDIEVRQGLGYKYVATGNLTQSGGVVADVWKPVIKKLSMNYELRTKNWLILGLAAGTVAKLIPQPAKITGVEIDPVMLEIGRQYFDLGQIPNLKILNLDAMNYILKTQDFFDFVLVDLYLGDQIPEFVYSQKFLGQLDKVGQLVIINHLFYDQDKRLKAEKLITQLKAVFKNIQLHHVLTNLLIICS